MLTWQRSFVVVDYVNMATKFCCCLPTSTESGLGINLKLK